MRTARYAAAGFLLGVVWGVAARAWMRLISTAPEFTWAGTLSIIVAAAVAGLALGLVAAARARGGSRWWRLVYLVVPVIFLGAGLPLLPGVVLGGWGLRRGLFARLVAAAAILSGPAVLLAMSWEEIDMGLNPYPDNVFRAIIGGGALALVATAAWGSSAALGPWTRRRESGASRSSEPAAVTA
jgi:hypothetical protein